MGSQGLLPAMHRGNSLSRSGSQLRREHNLPTGRREPDAVDMAIRNGCFPCCFLETERLRTELDMIVEPVALVTMFVFHRNKQTCSRLDHVGKTSEAQCFAVEVEARRLHLPFCRRVCPAWSTLWWANVPSSTNSLTSIA